MVDTVSRIRNPPLQVKKKEEAKKGPGAKDDKSEKKGKEDEEDQGYRLTTSEFVKALKAAEKTYVGELSPVFCPRFESWSFFTSEL